MSDNMFNDPTALVALRLEDRNRLAEEVIKEFADKHGAMDVAVGLIGMIPIPGAGIAALMGAIGLQAPVIYQPMARRLAQIYLAAPEELEEARNGIVADGIMQNMILDIAANFGVEFIKEIARELLVELGFGTLLGWIPIVGGIIAAGLDYKIATAMTRRVGTMVSIYFQNGGRWVGSKRNTYDTAKGFSGGLNDIRQTVPSVRDWLLRNVRAMIDLMRDIMNKDQIRSALSAKGVPKDLIDDALAGL